MRPSSSGDAFAASGIEVVDAAFDFGNVPFGSIVTHTVKLINHSDSILHITNVHPGCGCTQIPLRKKEVPVGETLEVALVLNTSKLTRGKFSKSPEIFTDNVQTSKITVKLSGFNYGPGDLTNLIRVNPETVAFKNGLAEAEIEVDIVNRDTREAFAGLITRPDSSHYRVKMPARPIAGGSSDKIKIRLNPNRKDSDFRESFTISLNDSRRTRYTIPVSLSY
jgi:hypothetical protein